MDWLECILIFHEYHASNIKFHYLRQLSKSMDFDWYATVNHVFTLIYITMAKSKCIKTLASDSTEIVFEKGRYYAYDFISSIGDNPSFFRVYFDDNKFHKMDVKTFKDHFKKF